MRYHILVADDHTLFRRGLVDLLNGVEGLSVVAEAADGRTALKQALHAKPNIVLMDLHMPGLNGWEATRQVLIERPETRIVGLSARSDTHSVGRLLEVGGAGYVLKSAAVEELLEAIRAVGRGEVYLGQGLTGAIVKQYVRNGNGRASYNNGHGDGHGHKKPRGLTDREREVLQLVAEGHSLKSIAGQLHVSTKTVEAHRATIMRKLELPSVAGLTKYAIREGITELEA